MQFLDLIDREMNQIWQKLGWKKTHWWRFRELPNRWRGRSAPHFCVHRVRSAAWVLPMRSVLDFRPNRPRSFGPRRCCPHWTSLPASRSTRCSSFRLWTLSHHQRCRTDSDDRNPGSVPVHILIKKDTQGVIKSGEYFAPNVHDQRGWDVHFWTSYWSSII
jgi:hypothetical protein